MSGPQGCGSRTGGSQTGGGEICSILASDVEQAAHLCLGRVCAGPPGAGLPFPRAVIPCWKLSTANPRLLLHPHTTSPWQLVLLPDTWHCWAGEIFPESTEKQPPHLLVHEISHYQGFGSHLNVCHNSPERQRLDLFSSGTGGVQGQCPRVLSRGQTFRGFSPGQEHCGAQIQEMQEAPQASICP